MDTAASSSKKTWPRLTIAEWIFGVLLVALWLFHDAFASTPAVVLIGTAMSVLWFLLVLWIFSSAFLLYSRRERPGLDRNLEKQISINGPFLSTTEKVLMWIFGLTIPWIVGIIISLLWYKKGYLKARQANLILMVGFFITNGIGFILFMAGIHISGII